MSRIRDGVPSLLVGVTLALAQAGEASGVTIAAGNAAGPPSSTVTIAISLENDVPVRAVQLQLTDTPNALTLVPGSARTTARSTALVVDASEQDDGSVIAVLISTDEALIAAGTGPVMEMDFTIALSASVGATITLGVWEVLVADADSAPLPADLHDGSVSVAGTPTPSPTVTPTPTSTRTPTASVPPSATETRTPTPVPTATGTPTRTSTVIPTLTATMGLTATASATRTATVVPTLATSTPTATGALDLVADQIEVVQSVQDLNNSVPLVANKRAFIRFHVHSVLGEYQTTARLRVQRGAEEPVSLMPVNPGGRVDVRPAPNRAVRDDAFLFALPSDFVNGTVALTAELNPNNDPVETNRSNNKASASVTFETVPPQALVLYSVGYEQAGRTYDPDDLDRTQLVEWLQRAFPISDLQVIQRSYFAGRGMPSCSEVNAYLAAKRLWDLASGYDIPASARYYGMVYDARGLMPGCAAGVVASGPTGLPDLIPAFAWDTDGTYGDWYGAHLLAHTWGRDHTEPYPDGRISPVLSGDAAMYGFDVITRALYEPTWKDLMSLRSYLWVGDVTYEGLLDAFRSKSGAGAAMQPPPRPLPWRCSSRGA